MSPEEIDGLDWEKQGGLLPAVVQALAAGRIAVAGRVVTIASGGPGADQLL